MTSSPPSALLRERFRKLQDFNKGNIILHLPVENILDSLFDERLEKNDLLPIGKKATIFWWKSAITTH